MNDPRILAEAIDCACADFEAIAQDRILNSRSAEDLANGLSRAYRLATSIGQAHADSLAHGRSLAEDLVPALMRAGERSRVLADRINSAAARRRAIVDGISHDLARARERGEQTAYDRGLARERSRALGDVLASAQGLAYAGSVARALTGAVSEIVARDRAHSRVLALAGVGVPETTEAFDVEASLYEDGAPGFAEVTSGGGRVSPSAGRLVAAAAQMLPEADRADYAEEFRSELRDLAQAGTGLAGQVAYAIRQLRSAPKLRLTLRSAARRRVSP